MDKEKRGKGSIWIREAATSVSFYQVDYGQKKKRLITVAYEDLVDKSKQLEVRKHFPYPEATTRLLQYFMSFESRHKEKLLPKKQFLDQKAILEALQEVEESIAELVKADPKCQKPDNLKLGYEVWRRWSKIRPNLNTVNGWNIKESDSQKALGWGSAGKREEDKDG
ncbi:hypothetical protein [Pseudomonas aeruginosa]|uniref:hypothetical protein n=1 Tax=Pseudomonas aeruginosa TaxID=287 RepID=UPI0022B7506F|nr:hypothetical protein [Pseudomonas aeruginosa]MCZ7719926.1 hypothetical protein [Pseudomonas aeruginosa]MCZ7823870.1 hypothetical protein [Pseudomonas aeruginosa]